jgi:hypothetical protein
LEKAVRLLEVRNLCGIWVFLVGALLENSTVLDIVVLVDVIFNNDCNSLDLSAHYIHDHNLTAYLHTVIAKHAILIY